MSTSIFAYLLTGLIGGLLGIGIFELIRRSSGSEEEDTGRGTSSTGDTKRSAGGGEHCQRGEVRSKRSSVAIERRVREGPEGQDGRVCDCRKTFGSTR